MVALKIVPKSANAFHVELYRLQGKEGVLKEVLAGTLECYSDGEKLYILHRENSFEPFTVTYGRTIMEEDKIKFETYELTLTLKRPEQK